MERFGFIKQKKGEWVCVKTPNGPFCHYEQVEQALAEKDREIEKIRIEQEPRISLRQSIISITKECAEIRGAYHALMGQAIEMAECAGLLSDASLRVGEFDSETDGWPIYHHTGGLHNECSGVIADIPYKKLADAFVKYHEHAVAFLASPEVQAWREQREVEHAE